ncbi:unnamed protein product [Clonostachys rosea]|uniref:GPI inositol-deacylase n=1 Tax=Bionectria ochroleuca TaxID=29856 RepID=A0ABY6UH32_BIOOC|nr:unnamed protein product [Clonostachys rosea]
MQPTKRSFSGFLSRSNTERVLRPSTPTSDDSSFFSATEDEPGKLGLTTVHEPHPSPPGPTVDIVFIHGLGGNSRKTWSFSSNPHSFWPKSWLATDPDFVDTARIHVFGYMASWKTRQDSPFNIHYIAQTLLFELKNDPGIRRDPTRIILVGHSMGGCVAKKAYVLARQDPACKDLGERVHSMFFLGTPHRGSDLAPVLDSMITVMLGKKPFVKDLIPNSSALTDMNDTFRHYALDLRLWSFYETKPVVTNLISRIVVEKSSSTLDYPNEEIAAMNADHRHMSKFESHDDPNYRLLRNALHTALDMATSSLTDHDIHHHRDSAYSYGVDSTLSVADELIQLMAYLGASENLEDDLTDIQVLKEPGSCEWFTQSDCFTTWEQGDAPQVLWLTGRPAAGKSILSGHVVDHLSTSTIFCSYFFFKHGTGGGSALSECLLSIAYQMAKKDDVIRERLLQLMDDQSTLDKTDESSIWRKLFIGTIFKCPSISNHIWILDGVDECANFNVLFTRKLLASMPKQLRLFATSRDLEEVSRGLTAMAPRVFTRALSEDDTIQDMRLFVTAKLTELDRLESVEEQDNMCDKILRKSQGSFLWVRLVLQEFENAWTDEAMEAVLEEVPTDLHDLYHRILMLIEADPRKKSLAKSILAWVVLAPRPLSIDELRCAMKLDLKQTLQNLIKAVPTICGQLVFVDKSQKVQIIHETARQFLLQAEFDSELGISKSRENTRIASLLVQYLSSDILKTNQARTNQSTRPKPFTHSKSVPGLSPALDLISYATRFFSHHVYHSSSENDLLTEDICTFLQSSNILHWIEKHAQWKNLGGITQTAMNLRGYLERRIKYVSPTDPQVHIIDSWVVDLIRVAAKFRAQLLTCPSSIYCLIPPLCPPESIISRRFSKEAKLSPLVVKNLPSGTWDDCLSRIDFTDGLTSVVTHGERLFAVGLTAGRIIVYNSHSLQSVREMSHLEHIKNLQFSLDEDFLVCCGQKQLSVWSTQSGALLLSTSLESPPLAITFTSPNELLLVSQTKGLFKWNLETGEYEANSWPDFSYSSQDMPDVPEQCPSHAVFSTVANGQDLLLAVAYRSYPVQIWDPVELQPLGQCGKDRINGVNDIVFNPNPEIAAFVISYSHGPLSVFDYTTMELMHNIPNCFATRISCSLDGRTLLTGNHRGIIQVFEFDLGRDGNILLCPIYRIQSTKEAIRGLSFSFDSLRFLDISRRQCRIWEPAALVRKDNELESTSEAVPIAQGGLNMPETAANLFITTPSVMAGGGHFLLAGKANGSVAIFNASDGSELAEAYRHGKGTYVMTLITAKSGQLIISACSGRHILVKQLIQAPGKTPNEQATPRIEAVLDRRFDELVAGLIASEGGDRLYICGQSRGELWELPSGKLLGAHQFSATSKSPASYSHSAFQHPADPSKFVVVGYGAARVFNWADFSEQTPSSGVILEQSHAGTTGLSPRKSSFYIGPNVVIEHVLPTASQTGRLIKWPATAFDPSSSLAGRPSRDAQLDALGPRVFSVVGIMASTKLIFIDLNHWLCSTELVLPRVSQQLSPSNSSTPARSPSPLRSVESVGRPNLLGNARRHFFALSEWRDRDKQISCTLLPTAGPSPMARSRQANFAFVAEDRLIIVQGGLEFSEAVSTGNSNKPKMKTFTSRGSPKVGTSPTSGGRFPDQDWTVVAGSMHRRASNW